jgi:hypothetical protein
MRSLALIALLGTFIATTSLVGQSLTEHAAAAAGATIGTAAGKPLGTALGNIFGSVDKSTSKAATPAKTAKPNPAVAKPSPVPETVAPTATITVAPSGGGGGVDIVGGGGGGGGGGGSSHHSSRRRQAPIQEEAAIAAPPIVPAVVEPVIKEPTVDEVASLKVGATASEMRATLGPPESMVSIPDDDGRLLETCQYWAKGQQIGTVRLENGKVVSVQTAN